MKGVKSGDRSLTVGSLLLGLAYGFLILKML